MKANNQEQLVRKSLEIKKRKEFLELMRSTCDISLCFNLENSYSMFNQQISIKCC